MQSWERFEISKIRVKISDGMWCLLLVFLNNPSLYVFILIARFRRRRSRMIRIIVTSITSRLLEWLFSRSNLNSLLWCSERREAVRRRSLFFQGLLAGSQGYIHQTPSAPIVSLHLRSSGDLQDPFRPFMHIFKYRPLRKFFTTSLRAASFIFHLKCSKILMEMNKSPYI